MSPKKSDVIVLDKRVLMRSHSISTIGYSVWRHLWYALA